MRTTAFYMQTSLLSAMLGASIAFAVAAAMAAPSYWSFLALLAVVLHATNFYHGKLILLSDPTTAIRTNARPMMRAAALVYNSSLFLAFCVMASGIVDFRIIAIAEIVLRVIDSVGIAAELRFGDRSHRRDRSESAAVRRHLGYWLRMNGLAVVVFGSILAYWDAQLWRLWDLPAPGLAVVYAITVACLVVLVLVDLGVEYLMFRSNYFNDEASWEELARRWDLLQGPLGDRYRARAIHPGVEGEIRLSGARRVVDLGCGNGCTLRYLVSETGVSGFGVDQSATMVDIARLYEDREKLGIDYAVGSIDGGVAEDWMKDARGSLSNDGGVAAVSLFAAQDCTSLDGFFGVASDLLHSGELLVIVYETPSSFDVDSLHSSTVRSWRYSIGGGEAKQVVAWLPVTLPQAGAVVSPIHDSGIDPILVSTHFRRLEDYRRVAVAYGFEEARAGDLLLVGVPQDLSELQYSRAPKFAMVSFLKAPRPSVP